jgi:hypothetical protein
VNSKKIAKKTIETFPKLSKQRIWKEKNLDHQHVDVSCFHLYSCAITNHSG